MSASRSLLVIAKDPQPGRAKTRLCPPCEPAQAAELAAAALRDTLDVVLSVEAERHVLVLAGDVERWRRPGLEIIPQRGGGLDERLENAFLDVGSPALLVGMDTPQLTGELLRTGLRMLDRHDAVLGMAPDGGYWAVGLRTPHAGSFIGVPMSQPDTGERQRERLAELGLAVAELPVLHDVDTIADALAVAAAAPGSRFARAVRAVVGTLDPSDLAVAA